MKRKDKQVELLEETSMVSEVELIYHSKVKPADRPLIRKSEEAYKLLINTWNKDTIELYEEFKVVVLNQAGRVIGIYKAGMGGLTRTIADPRLIITTALKAAACSIVLAHNHPSGNLTPSKSDEEMTRKMKAGAELLEIKVLDHLIITLDGYTSFADQGLL